MRIAISTMLLGAVASMDCCFALIWYKRGKERPQISFYHRSWCRRASLKHQLHISFVEVVIRIFLTPWKLSAWRILRITRTYFFRYFRAHYQCHSFGPKKRLALWSGPCNELPSQHRWWSFLEENLFQALLWHQKRNLPQTEHRDPWKYGVCQSGDILVSSYFQGKKVGRLGRFHRFTKFWGMHCIEAPNRWNIAVDLFKLSSCFNHGLVGSVPRVLDRRARGRGFDPLCWINTQGIEIAEKWGYYLCPVIS